MNRNTILRLLIVLAPLLYFFAGTPARQAQAPQSASSSFARTAPRLLAEHCVMCHNAKKKTGGLDLTQFQSVASIVTQRDTWELVVQKLQSGEMPPAGLPRPDPAALKAALRAIEAEFERADKRARPDPGRVTARRLNRAEYNNTVRDLLGVRLRPAESFPQDDSGYGFDNIGDVLSLSPVLMEKYLTAAEQLARTAVFGPEPLKPTLTRIRSDSRSIKSSVTPLAEYDVSGLSLPNAAHAAHRIPVDAEYSIRAYLGGVRPAGSEPLQLGLWIDGKLTEQFGFDPEGLASFSEDRQDFGSMRHEFRARLNAGDHSIAISVMRLYEGLPASYGGPNPSKRPAPAPPVFRMPNNATPERVAAARKRFEARLADRAPVNDARVQAIEIAGPYNQAQGPAEESRQKIFVCGHEAGRHQPGCERRIVQHVARRAFRRPVAKAEVDRLAGLVALVQSKGDSFEEGVAVALQAILVSPHFLFRIEQDRQDRPAADTAGYALSPHELASRLSYFLWSSMPDEELLRAADEDALRRPDVLAAQIQRMLRDENSRALVENFGGQWLELRKLESVKPDRERFPDFDLYFRTSMQRETELFFEHVIREDGRILDFLDSRYSFLNERLARFYGIAGVAGPEFRKVALPAETGRGGVLTQAAVLTVSSYATRTSPVLRGKWILENLLNAPPPPPPPDVPNLDEAQVGSTASLRQQLEAHRKNATCAACHARMDPLGFGLEKFDAIGRWRTRDGKFPVDDSGLLPDGRAFRGPTELKTILMADRDAFVQCLTEKLLTYALGRGLERYDKPAIKQIAARVAARDYRFSALTQEIATSLPFQRRRK
jgi:mono/diheme cytochrome c family protein